MMTVDKKGRNEERQKKSAFQWHHKKIPENLVPFSVHIPQTSANNFCTDFHENLYGLYAISDHSKRTLCNFLHSPVLM